MATLHCGEAVFTNIQAVIFDKDGTLAGVELFLYELAHCRSQAIEAQIPGIQAELLKAFGVKGDRGNEPQFLTNGHRLNPAGLMAVGSRQENAIAAAAYVAATGRGWAESLELVQAGFRAADRSAQPKAKQTPLLPGARALLERLTAAGLMLGILSSDSQDNVDDFVVTYRLDRHFQTAVGVQGNLSKSDPKIVEQVLLKLGASPMETLLVGDSQIDIQIAKGCHLAGCIGFTGGWSTPPDLTNANVLIERLDQIQIL